MLNADEIEKEKLCYVQNFKQFRSLNQTMWQVPVIATTLTGGLWFGAANLRDMKWFAFLLLALAAVADFGLVIVLGRVRFVMGEYLSALERFYPAGFVGAKGTGIKASGVVAGTFRCLLGLSGLLSAIAAIVILCRA